MALGAQLDLGNHFFDQTAFMLGLAPRQPKAGMVQATLSLIRAGQQRCRSECFLGVINKIELNTGTGGGCIFGYHRKRGVLDGGS